MIAYVLEGKFHPLPELRPNSTHEPDSDRSSIEYVAPAFDVYANTPAVPYTAVSDNLAAAFYRFFRNDDWGRRFTWPDSHQATVDVLARTWGVLLHAETDLDTDNRRELWMSYGLMYGETGAMVYELRDDGGWESVANHCFKCD